MNFILFILMCTLSLAILRAEGVHGRSEDSLFSSGARGAYGSKGSSGGNAFEAASKKNQENDKQLQEKDSAFTKNAMSSFMEQAKAATSSEEKPVDLSSYTDMFKSSSDSTATTAESGDPVDQHIANLNAISQRRIEMMKLEMGQLYATPKLEAEPLSNQSSDGSTAFSAAQGAKSETRSSNTILGAAMEASPSGGGSAYNPPGGSTRKPASY